MGRAQAAMKSIANGYAIALRLLLRKALPGLARGDDRDACVAAKRKQVACIARGDELGCTGQRCGQHMVIVGVSAFTGSRCTSTRASSALPGRYSTCVEALLYGGRLATRRA